jgi:hypothetical protein
MSSETTEATSMQKLRIALAAMAMVIALAVLATSMPARAQNPGKQYFTFSGTLFDSCTGEHIAYTVTERLDIYIHSDATGGFHGTIHQVFKGTGVGLTSGTNYVISEVIVEEENASATNLGFEFNSSDNFSLNSQGSMPNERAIVTQHITVNANGNVTVDRFNITDDCKG